MMPGDGADTARAVRAAALLVAREWLDLMYSGRHGR